MKNVLLITILGIAALGGGLGVVLAANHYGWLRPEGMQAAPAAAVCEHDIAPNRCPFCNPELVESLGWCAGHDVPEAYCTRCTPSLIPAFKATNDWCAEHNLPESQCAICGAAGAVGQPVDVTAPALASLSRATSEEETMRVNRKPSSTCTNVRSTVQLASPDIARRAGLQVESVTTATVHDTVTCNADVAFDGDFTANLASRAPGIITEVAVDLGDHVDTGDVLAIVDSADLGSAKAAFLQARSLVNMWEKNHAREQSLYEQEIATEKGLLEAETRLVESRVALSGAMQRLRNLGLSDEDIERIESSGDTSSRLPLRAPFAGVIVERHAVPGEVVATDKALFKIADLQTMWVILDVDERDAARLTLGRPVAVTVDAMPQRSFEGELTWISAQVDPRTRTVQARAEVANPDGLLRAHMYGQAQVHVRTMSDAVLVPESAVQWDGCCNVVFVRHTDTIYQPYQVTLGPKQGGYFVVEDGLPPGESVVTQGSFLLKTEILKGNIGAGCCEVDPGAAKG